MADIVDDVRVGVSVEDNASDKLNKITNNIKNLENSVKNADSTIKKSSIGKINRDGVAPQLETSNNIQNTTEIKENIKDVSKETDKATNANSKFLQSLKRIAMYRLIRSVLKEIGNAAKQGLGNLRTENEQLDKSLSNLSASATSLKNSFAAMLSPIIQSMQPAITAISDGIANFINRINEAKAATQGQDKYTRILTSDTEEYQKALEKANGSLLSFDTFTKLNNKDSYTGVISDDVKMDIEEAQGFTERIGNLTKAIGALGIAIATVKIAKWAKTLTGAFAALNIETGILVAGIGTLIYGITQFAQTWQNMSEVKRWTNIFIALGAAILAAAISLHIFSGNWAMAIGAGALVAGGVLTMTAAMNKTPKTYANGGSFNTGDYFVANENGNTELVASTNHGGAVMNTEQLQEAIYNGMSMALINSGSKEITLKVDNNTLGRVVANSTGFISETNRRNASLNLV